MVCEACRAKLPFDELIKLQEEEEEVLSGLQALRPELMNSYFIMSAVRVCMCVHSFHMCIVCMHVCVYVYVRD